MHKIRLGPERLISAAPANIHEWGPWQFPVLHKDADGTLYLSFHNAADTYSSYGLKPCLYRSSDGGKTWSETDHCGGLPLADGAMVRPAQVSALPVDTLSLPAPLAECKYCYVKDAQLYKIEEVAAEYKTWYRYRVADGAERLEEIHVDSPGYLMRKSVGLFIRPFFYTPYFIPGPRGGFYVVTYHPQHNGGKTTTYFNAQYYVSHDDCRSFELVSSIPFAPPYSTIPDSANCQGWLEPSLCFTDEDTAFTLLRTTCVTGTLPLFIAWSHDGLRTWTEPEYFDDVGVSPQAIRLDNGVVLASYGRPGLFVRSWEEGTWADRTTVVEPGELQTDTCSYSALAPLGPDRALIVYSRFQYPLGPADLRKAMLCREIIVTQEDS